MLHVQSYIHVIDKKIIIMNTLKNLLLPLHKHERIQYRELMYVFELSKKLYSADLNNVDYTKTLIIIIYLFNFTLFLLCYCTYILHINLYICTRDVYYIIMCNTSVITEVHIYVYNTKMLLQFIRLVIRHARLQLSNL